MAARAAAASPDIDLRVLVDGTVLLASTATAVMQLARPAVGYGVLESTVEGAQAMRHPVRRLRNTITYMSVALMGTDEERAYYRRQVNRAHALVRSGADSPVSYNAFDPRLQLWVAACLYRGGMDVRTRLHGPLDEATADAIYRQCRLFGTSLQVPEHMWPADRAAFEEYWAAALAELRIDPPVRDYLNGLIMCAYLPWPFGTALGPLNRFLTTGFLPPPVREQMQLDWTERDQRQFDLLIEMIASVNRLLPAPVTRFPFNACLHELRLRRMRNRLTQLGRQSLRMYPGDGLGRGPERGLMRVAEGARLAMSHQDVAGAVVADD